MNFFWAKNKEQVRAAAEFFVKYVTPDYISHGEIQSGRAIDFSTWSPNAVDVIEDEFQECLRMGKFHDAYLAIAEDQGEIVSVVFIQTYDNSKVSFGVFEDILTRPDHRNKGIGSKLYYWIEEEMKAKGIKTLFLESGIENTGAHPFLKSLGFGTCSLVMNKGLA